jgi:hypothetical protein
MLNYGLLTTLADALPDPPGFPTGADCYDWISVSSRPYADSYCSDAFDYVVSYVQTADFPLVVVSPDGLSMTSPYSCALNGNDVDCVPECQADLDLLARACHAEDVVVWAGKGLPNGAVAAPGVVLSPLQAFAYFLSGVAAVPFGP